METMVYRNSDDSRQDGWNFLLRWRRFEKGQLFFNVWCGAGNYQRLERHLCFRRPGTQPLKIYEPRNNQMATKHSISNIRTTVLLHKLRLLQPLYTIHAERIVTKKHSIWMCLIYKHSHVNYSSCNAVRLLQPNKLDIKKTATFEACSWKNNKNISYKRKLLRF